MPAREARTAAEPAGSGPQRGSSAQPELEIEFDQRIAW